MSPLRLELLVRTDVARTLSPNGRASWPVKRRATDEVRRAAHIAALDAVGRDRTDQLGRVDVRVTLVARTRARRDPDNVAGIAKPALDGIVDAGVLADDNATRVRSVAYAIGHDPELRRGVHRLELELEEVSP